MEPDDQVSLGVMALIMQHKATDHSMAVDLTTRLLDENKELREENRRLREIVHLFTEGHDLIGMARAMARGKLYAGE